MADNNRNRGYQSDDYNQNWEQQRERYDQDRTYGQNRNYGNSNYNEEHYSNRKAASYGELYGGNVERREQETNQARPGRYRPGYSNQDQDYGYSPYRQEDIPPGYAHVGNTGGDNGAYGDYLGNRGDFDRNFGDPYERRGARSQQREYQPQSSRRENYGDRSRWDREQHQDSGDNWWDRTVNKVSSWFGNEDDDRRGSERSLGTNYRGKGPRGYSRTAERIKEDVCYRLYDDSYVDASDIEVTVEGSEVILAGTVHSRDEKRRAEDLAEAISGVSNVQNHLRVARSTTDSSNAGTRSGDANREMR